MFDAFGGKEYAYDFNYLLTYDFFDDSRRFRGRISGFSRNEHHLFNS